MRTFDLILSLVVIAIIIGVPYTGLIPNFGYAVPILLVVWLALKKFDEGFSDLMFRWKGFSLHAALIGTLAGILVFSFLQLVFFPILESFVSFNDPEPEINQFMKQSPWNLTFILVMGWLIGGVYEELVFHGFMFTRFEKIIPGRYATLISFLITNIIFGLYHLELGTVGIINAFLAGMAYLGVALYFNRNLWYSIICHGVYNTIVIIFIYNGYLF